MKTITFYSYKGGVGRSLALANIATRLAEFGRRVCLLDFDLEAPGLHFKFSSSFDSSIIQKGIVDYIYKFSESGALPNSIKEYSYSFLNSQANKEITIIPAGNVNSPNYWKKLSSINWYELIYENPSGLTFLLDLKEKIRTEIKPDFLLIDSRTGISEISGITLSLLADEVVVLAANNSENLSGTKKIISSITKQDNAILEKIPKVTYVLSRIPFTEKPEDRIRELQLVNKVKREFGNLISEVNVIHSDRELEENEQIKIGYDKDETVAQISRDYLNLFEKLTFNDLSATEISRFRDLKDSERNYQRALSENSLPKKLEFINKAIDFNPQNADFRLYRALVFEALGQMENTELECVYILKTFGNLSDVQEVLGRVLYSMKRIPEAKLVYKEILNQNEGNLIGHMGLGMIYTVERKYEDAIKSYERIIELDPTNPIGYNGRANIKRHTQDYQSALSDVYKALELNPGYGIAYATLAELHAHLGNINDFYLNLENAMRLDLGIVENAINHEEVYKQFFKEDRFKRMLERYKIELPEG